MEIVSWNNTLGDLTRTIYFYQGLVVCILFAENPFISFSYPVAQLTKSLFENLLYYYPYVS